MSERQPPSRPAGEAVDRFTARGVPAPEIAPPAPFHAGRVLRWLLVVPAGFLGWYAGVFVGLVLRELAVSLCDPAQMVSGGCGAGWFPAAAALAVHTGVAVAAMGVVLLPTLVAPSFRGTVAWTAYGFGAAAAGNLAWLTGAWTEMLVAVLVGFVVLWLALRRWRSDGHARPRARSSR